MPRTKEQNEEIKEATIIKIREAGLKLFAVKGLVATSIVDISETAGISTGLMYHYYKSKEELYAELVTMAITGANTAVCEIAALPVCPREKIVLLAQEILKQITADEYTAYFYVFMPQVLLNKGLLKKAQRLLKDAYVPVDKLKEIVVEGQQAGEIKEGNPDALTTLFFSTITGLCTWKLIKGKKFVLPQPEMLTSILLNNQ
ncbi:MAG: TetR/AcrR family transcriptional regulator [Tannerella sp.]|jgi:AcrR family transcriptional regulator|nr:TetR/AcrR family transcriptional regulator [Tannerella sp.]